MRLTAADIMSRPVISIGAVTPVRELMRLLIDNEITGVPVTDESGNLAGVVSIVDVLSVNEGEEEIQDRIPDFYTSPAMDGLAQINRLLEPDPSVLDMPVSALMCRGIVTLGKTATLAEISNALVERRIHRLLIVEESEVVGIVSVGDVLRAIGRTD